ncbi:DUF2271 domain-containing protein [Caulifigura coniformis]|nr:DUF2271 domain-containing protein [Caulifigura coniformis]
MLAVAAAVVSAAPALAADRYAFQHDFVLGTSLDLEIVADSEQAASAAESLLLAEINRLAGIFSTYDANSELSRWQSAVGVPAAVSSELFEALAACERWHEVSRGAFNPAAASLTAIWQQAQREQRLPSADELARCVDAIERPQWTLDPATRTATRLTNGPLSLDAIAKGGIVDRAVAKALAAPGVRGIMACIGGDLRAAGDIEMVVNVADPHHDEVNAAPLCSIVLKDAGLATSGNYRRGFDIAGRHWSHILDPRTGQPANSTAGVTVIAESTETADALATMFSVLTPAEVADVAGTLSGVDYLLVTEQGRQIPSPGWTRRVQAAKAASLLAQAEAKPPAAKSELLELVVNFELNKPSEEQYRRPYVAVWMEDADGFPVRTAVLWMQTKQPGPRWHRDLLRWFKNDRVRKLADEKDLIGVISGATRGPGEYKAVFDGLDDAGKPLKPGKYTLYIEAAREHGTYQLIRHPLQLGAEPIPEAKLKSNVEIKSASVEYRKPQPARPDGSQPAS